MTEKIKNSINPESLRVEMNHLRNINRTNTNNSSPEVEELELNETISAEVSTQGGDLNLRSGPGTDNGVIGSIANGTKLEVIEADDGSGWTKVKLEDGTIYFSNLKNKNINLFTNEKMNGKIIHSMAFYKSSLFYQMYLDNLINTSPIQVDEEVYMDYAKNWDGSMHSQTFDNAISLKINEYVNQDLKKK